MATRIIRLVATGVGTSDTVIPDEDGNTVIQPPNNVKWTLVEIRMGLSAAGNWKGFFNTEKYHSGKQDLDFLAKGVPHTVTLDIELPNQYQIKAAAASGTINVDAELVIEESPLTGA